MKTLKDTKIGETVTVKKLAGNDSALKQPQGGTGLFVRVHRGHPA